MTAFGVVPGIMFYQIPLHFFPQSRFYPPICNCCYGLHASSGVRNNPPSAGLAAAVVRGLWQEGAAEGAEKKLHVRGCGERHTRSKTYCCVHKESFDATLSSSAEKSSR